MKINKRNIMDILCRKKKEEKGGDMKINKRNIMDILYKEAKRLNLIRSDCQTDYGILNHYHYDDSKIGEYVTKHYYELAVEWQDFYRKVILPEKKSSAK